MWLCPPEPEREKAQASANPKASSKLGVSTGKDQGYAATSSRHDRVTTVSSVLVPDEFKKPRDFQRHSLEETLDDEFLLFCPLRLETLFFLLGPRFFA